MHESGQRARRSALNRGARAIQRATASQKKRRSRSGSGAGDLEGDGRKGAEFARAPGGAGITHLEDGRAADAGQVLERALALASVRQPLVLLAPTGARPTPQDWQALLERGVLVRDVGLPGWLRVTVGTPEEMKDFMAALEAACAEEAS